MKAIFINSVARTISIINIAKGLEVMQKVVGGLIQPINLDPINTLWVDEEGKLKNPENFFFIAFGGHTFPEALAGDGLILGLDKDGESCDTSLEPSDIRVEFFTRGELEALGVETEPLKHILYDARFIKSIEIINDQDRIKAVYMVRICTGLGLATAKKYIRTIERFKYWMTNPLQY